MPQMGGKTIYWSGGKNTSTHKTIKPNAFKPNAFKPNAFTHPMLLLDKTTDECTIALICNC